MFTVPPVSPLKDTIRGNEVTVSSATGRAPLESQDKAEAIAAANGTTVLARATPTYTANQVIAVHFDGLAERAVFCDSSALFDYYKTDASLVAASPSYYGANTAVITKWVKFVKFAGANLLANTSDPEYIP